MKGETRHNAILIAMLLLFSVNGCSITPESKPLVSIQEEVSDAARIFYDNEKLDFGIEINSTNSDNITANLTAQVLKDDKQIKQASSKIDIPHGYSLSRVNFPAISAGKYKLDVKIAGKAGASNAVFPFTVMETVNVDTLKEIEADQPGHEEISTAGAKLTAHPCLFKIAIDGDLSEWANVPSIPLIKGDSKLIGNVRLVWDWKHLHIAATIPDDTPTKESEVLEENDHLVIAFDPLRNSIRTFYDQEDHELVIGWSKNKIKMWHAPFYETYWSLTPEMMEGLGFKASYDETKSVWIYEGSIPFAPMFAVRPGIENLVGFKLFFHDRKNGKEAGVWRAKTDGTGYSSGFGELGFDLTDEFIQHKETEQQKKIRDELKTLETQIAKAKNQGKYTYPFEITATIAKDFYIYARSGTIKCQWNDFKEDKLDKSIEEWILNAVTRASKEVDASKLSSTLPESWPRKNLTINNGYFTRDDKPYFWFAPFSVFGSSHRDMHRFHNFGMNSANLHAHFLVRQLFPKKGCVDRRALDTLRYFVDKGEKSKLDIYLDFNVGTFEHLKFLPYPTKTTPCTGTWMYYCIEDPYYLKGVDKWFKEVLELTRGRHNVLFYETGNEIWQYRCHCRYAVSRFREWLKKQYGTVEAVNRIWKTNYRSIDEINLLRIKKKEHKAAFYDVATFQQERITAFFSEVRDIIHRYDPDKPVSLKFHSHVFMDPYHTGGDSFPVDFEKILQSQDFSIVDIIRGTFPVDFCKSVSPNKPFLNTEAHMTYALRMENELAAMKSADRMRRNLWEEAIRGEQGSWFWCWGREMSESRALKRNYDFKTNKEYDSEWEKKVSKLTPWGEMFWKPEELESFGKTGLEIRRFSDVATTCAQSPAPIGILYSRSSHIQDGNSHMGFLPQLYELIQYLDVKTRFVTEQTILTLSPKDVPLLIVPQVRYISDDAYNAIKDYVRAGGNLCVWGDFLPFDSHGKPREGKFLSQPFNDTEDSFVKVAVTGKGSIFRLSSYDTGIVHTQLDKICDKIGINRQIRAMEAKGSGPSRTLILPKLEGTRTIELRYFQSRMEQVLGVEMRYVKSDNGEWIYITSRREKPAEIEFTGLGSGTLFDAIQGKMLEKPKLTLPPDSVHILKIVR